MFPNSKVLRVERIPAGPAQGSTLVEFEIDGLKFGAVDGGPIFKFTPAISFVIPCGSQEEIDYYWDRLSECGTKGQCGWLEDKFGLSWQMVPAALDEIMGSNPETVMEAMLAMKKIDIGELRRIGACG